MTKTLFVVETEINASPKTLFPFINSASLLEKWLADQVTEEEPDVLVFQWDEQKYRARRVAKKENQFVKFEFEDADEASEKSYLELKLQNNDMTNTTFLLIEEYTEVDDPEDFTEVYNHCFNTLKAIVGGTNV